jgi:hypothetical protein
VTRNISQPNYVLKHQLAWTGDMREIQVMVNHPLPAAPDSGLML